jgi:hypothetical protein
MYAHFVCIYYTLSPTLQGHLKKPLKSYIHTCLYAYKLIYIHAYIHTCLYAYMLIYIHAYIHTCLYTYMLIYIHAYMHTGSAESSLIGVMFVSLCADTHESYSCVYVCTLCTYIPHAIIDLAKASQK